MTDIPVVMNRNPNTGRLLSSFQQIPSEYMIPTQNWLPAIVPMALVYPRPDAEITRITHHNVAYTGMQWDCPIRVLGGSSPKWAVIESAPFGMTVGNGWDNSSGVLTLSDDALNLRWPSPTAGAHSIRVRVYSQDNSSVVVRFTLTVSTANHFFTAPSNMGTGDGLSPANAKAFSATYLGATTLSPAQGKVLVGRGGSYTMQTVSMVPAYNPTSFINYPNETPDFTGVSSRNFEIKASDAAIVGIKFSNFDVTAEGVITNKGLFHRMIVWKCEFTDISISGGSNNQCGVYLDRQDTYKRKDIVVSQCTYTNFHPSAYDFYSTQNSIADRIKFIITDPAFTSMLVSPVFFPKSGNVLHEISFNTFDNPTVVGSTSTNAIIYPYNAATGEAPYQTTLVEYNFVRCNGGSAFAANGAANGSGYSTIANVYPRRNTFIGGGVLSQDYDATSPRQTHYDSNVIQNSGGITGGAGSYTSVRAECTGSSGVVDAAGKLTGTYKTNYLGSRGCELNSVVA